MPLHQRPAGYHNRPPPEIVDPPTTGGSSQSNSFDEEDYRHDELTGHGDDEAAWEDDYETDDLQPSDSASASHGRSQIRQRPVRGGKRHRIAHHPAPSHHPRAAPVHAPASPPSMMDSSEDYAPYQQRGYPNQQAAPYYAGGHAQGQMYHPNQPRPGGHGGYQMPGYGQMVPHQGYYDGGGHPFSPMSNGSSNGAGYFGSEPPRPYGGMSPYHQQPQYYGHQHYNLPAHMQQFQLSAPVPPPTDAPAPSTTPAPDKEKQKLAEQLAALQAEKEKAEMMQRQVQIEAKIRRDAEENFRRRMEEMRAQQEETRLEIDKARMEAERTARERLEAERKAQEEQAKREADAMKRAEENARVRIEGELKAAEERRKIEDEARARAEEAARIRLETAIRKEAADKAEAEKKAAEEVERLKRIHEDAKMKAEAEAAKKVAEEKEAEKKKADDEAEAKKAAEKLKAQIEEATKAEMEAAAKKSEKKPIKFKDAVGRKFSFPFHLCKTWAGMEELIKQAFLQVEELGPHVQEGRYDLTGPDGEIILPSVWEKVIEPDWQIVMTMWPVEKQPPPGPRIPPMMGGKRGARGGGLPFAMPEHIGRGPFGGAGPPGGMKIPPPPHGFGGGRRTVLPDGVEVMDVEPPGKKSHHGKKNAWSGFFGAPPKKSSKKKSSSSKK